MGEHAFKRLIIGMTLGLISAALVVLFTELLFPTVFNKFELQTLDLRFSRKIDRLEHLRDGNKIEDIVIVDIDNRSLNKLGRYHQWPRDYYAEIISYLSKAGVRIIGFDILFMEHDIDNIADTLLVQATRNAKNVCHSVSFSQAEPDAFLYKMNVAPPELNVEDFSYIFPPEIMNQIPSADRFDGKFFDLYNASQKIGFANYQPDDDSVIRKMPLFMNFAGRLYPSLAMAMVLHLFHIQHDQIEIKPGDYVQLHVSGKTGAYVLEIPIDRMTQMLINYNGTFQTFRYISFYDVYMHRIPQEFFKDKIIIIGASAPGLEDIRPVPFQEVFPGVEIHANILYNILTQDFIYKKPKAINLFILILLCLIVGIVSSFFKMSINIPLLVIIASGYILGTFYAFMENSVWIENVRPFIGIIFSQIAVLGFKYFNEIKDKKRIKGMFQNYLSPAVVNELLQNPNMLKLGGERKIATAFFSDIKNFTSYSEMLEPELLVSYLNEYLSAVSEIILKYDGYLDKYEGDAVVAIFGVPIEQPDHAVRACLAALDIQERLTKLRKKWIKQNRPPFETRIGINSGPMIAGNIGGTSRFDYTAIGDSVNLASRLEGVNKVYKTSIIISEATFKKVSQHVWCRKLDFIRVKGKSHPVQIYEVIARKTQELDNNQKACYQYFLKGLKKYREHQFIDAQIYFEKALSVNSNDGPSKEFIRRCQYFTRHPLPASWDGVFDLKNK